jgi:hypothetical protein
MRFIRVAIVLAFTSLAACSGPPIWHDQVLPSGKTIKVTSFSLVWGIEHDVRDASKDCLQLEFVWTNPAADAAAQEREALEVFELIRPASELWQFKTAVLSAFPTLERKGRHSFFSFTRGADGKWSSTRGEL